MECVHSDDGGGADGEIRYGFTWAISHLLPEDPDNNQNSHIPSFWRILYSSREEELDWRKQTVAATTEASVIL